MGKFNLNQILNEASKQAAAGGEPKPRPAESRFEKLSVFDLVPSEDNFYSMREIEELSAAILLAGKVLQNLVVVPLDGGKYKVIAGHRRRLASIALVEKGHPQYEFMPCDIEPTEEAAENQEIRDGLNLIVTNSQREKTVWDKIEEVRYLRSVLERAKENPRFVAVLQDIAAQAFGGGEVQADGTRDFIAKVLHTTPAQIGRYDTIIRHLCPEFKAELEADRIGVSAAYEIAGLTEEDQRVVFEEYKARGTIEIRDARARKMDKAPPAAAGEEHAPPSPPRPEQQPEKPAEPERDEQTPQDAPEDRREPPAETGRDNTQTAEKAAEKPQEAEGEGKPASAAIGEERETEEADTAAEQEPKATERATVDDEAIMQLESLRDYCKAMDDSESDGGSRVWVLDVDALEAAISYIRRG